MTRRIGPAVVKSGRRALGGVLVAMVTGVAAMGCGGSDPATAPQPHVDHLKLPPHKTWKVVSVQPYAGLEEVELVRVDWPTAQAGTYAFALTREGLEAGAAVCLDHIHEIDTFWAHPMPSDGCDALGKSQP